MNDYQTKTKFIKALEYDLPNISQLFSFIGVFLSSLPVSEYKKEIVKIFNLLNSTKKGDYITFINNKFGSVPKKQFEKVYQKVQN